MRLAQKMIVGASFAWIASLISTFIASQPSGRITFSGFVDDVCRFSWRQDFEDDVCWVAVERAGS
jgi:hypothetical protein